jgi:hypothetical protein
MIYISTIDLMSRRLAKISEGPFQNTLLAVPVIVIFLLIGLILLLAFNAPRQYSEQDSDDRKPEHADLKK